LSKTNGVRMRHSARDGVVRAHAGRRTSVRRDAQSPPNASANPAYDSDRCTGPGASTVSVRVRASTTASTPAARVVSRAATCTWTRDGGDAARSPTDPLVDWTHTGRSPARTAPAVPGRPAGLDRPLASTASPPPDGHTGAVACQ